MNREMPRVSAAHLPNAAIGWVLLVRCIVRHVWPRSRKGSAPDATRPRPLVRDELCGVDIDNRVGPRAVGNSKDAFLANDDKSPQKATTPVFARRGERSADVSARGGEYWGEDINDARTEGSYTSARSATRVPTAR